MTNNCSIVSCLFEGAAADESELKYRNPGKAFDNKGFDVRLGILHVSVNEVYLMYGQNFRRYKSCNINIIGNREESVFKFLISQWKWFYIVCFQGCLDRKLTHFLGNLGYLKINLQPSKIYFPVWRRFVSSLVTLHI